MQEKLENLKYDLLMTDCIICLPVLVAAEVSGSNKIRPVSRLHSKVGPQQPAIRRSSLVNSAGGPN